MQRLALTRAVVVNVVIRLCRVVISGQDLTMNGLRSSSVTVRPPLSSTGRRRSLFAAWLLVGAVALIPGCGDDGPRGTPDAAVSDVDDAATAADLASEIDVLVAAPCDPTRPPVVMAHGFLAAGDTWASFGQLFIANGDCPERLFAFDWNPFDRDPAPGLLDAFIDTVLATTGATQVQLMGHSAGGGLGWTYLLDPTHAAKVSHYAHVASSPRPAGDETLGSAGPADSPVPTLNVWSAGDTVLPGADIEGAGNARFEALDHYQVATDPAAFAAIYQHFRGESPATLERTDAPIAVPGKRRVSGKALTIGENVPVVGATVSISPVDENTGLSKGDVALASFTVGDDGAFGPVSLDPGVPYVFVLSGPTPEARTVRYYREPFVADDAFVYLRALPGSDSLVGLLFDTIPFAADSSVVIAFSASRGVLHGRDTLTVAGEEVSTPEFASAARTAIAWFFFDDGEDKTPGDLIGSFNILPTFLVALDRVYLTSETEPLRLTLNGRTLTMPRLSAANDGALVAIFD